MVKRPSTVNPTPARFQNEMQAFISHIGAVVRVNEDGRSRFPEFRLTDVIKEKIMGANQRFADGDLEGAFDLLRDVTRHFQNQQAGYAKNSLIGDLRKEMAWISENCDQDLVERAAKAVKSYEDLVTSNSFDLEKVSRTYWSAIDELEEIQRLDESRAGDRQRQQIEKQAAEVMERRRKQDEATERARQLAEGRRREVAEKLNAQLTAL